MSLEKVIDVVLIFVGGGAFTAIVGLIASRLSRKDKEVDSLVEYLKKEIGVVKEENTELRERVVVLEEKVDQHRRELNEEKELRKKLGSQAQELVSLWQRCRGIESCPLKGSFKGIPVIGGQKDEGTEAKGMDTGA